MIGTVMIMIRNLVIVISTQVDKQVSNEEFLKYVQFIMERK